MIWRTPDAAAERIRADASGVYLIRPKGGAIVYIGESHTRRLRKTMKRHFQDWTGPTAGPTYSAMTHEVAIVPAPAARAVAIQDKLIEKHQPKDNTIGLEAKANAEQAKAEARERAGIPPKDPKTGKFKKRSVAAAPAPGKAGTPAHVTAGAVRHVHLTDWLFH